MKEVWDIPDLNNNIICIADINSEELVAVVSSCLAKESSYLPLFIFPDVNTMCEEDVSFEEDGYISKIIGNEASVLINNVNAKMGGYDRALFIGMNDCQKSYFSKYIENPLMIDCMDDVDTKLASIVELPKETLSCRKEDVLVGLFEACKEGKRLVIDESTEVSPSYRSEGGLIVVEKGSKNEIHPIIAVNYAFALGADLLVVDGISVENVRTVESRLQRWINERNHNHFRKVISKVTSRVGDFDFSQYTFATFFTKGLPYGLGIENSIPNTHVNLSLRPDLFICNGIGLESGGRFHSAVVFSPQFFADEETEAVISVINSKNYFLRKLLGSSATSNSFDFHVQHFPYDIFHICSHGGEMDGYEVLEKFKDRKGVEHTIEYDEAVSFAAVPGDSENIAVTQKKFFRKFDGYKWMSPQLRAQNIPHYVFEDMRKSIMGKVSPKNPRTKKKSKIPAAYAIQCSDGFHQGSLRILASHNSPFIFNNSCWSWGDISQYFISGGARGYVGTLWSVDNVSAVSAATSFYDDLKDYSMMTSLHRAHSTIKGSPSENIYLYWGLHFSSLSIDAVSKETSRQNVFTELMRALYSWIEKVEKTPENDVKHNSIRVVKDIHSELMSNFNAEDLKKLLEKSAQIDEMVQAVDSEEREGGNDIENASSLREERTIRKPASL